MMVDPETGGAHTAHTNLPCHLYMLEKKRLTSKLGANFPISPRQCFHSLNSTPPEMRALYYSINQAQRTSNSSGVAGFSMVNFLYSDSNCESVWLYCLFVQSSYEDVTSYTTRKSHVWESFFFCQLLFYLSQPCR